MFWLLPKIKQAKKQMRIKLQIYLRSLCYTNGGLNLLFVVGITMIFIFSSVFISNTLFIVSLINTTFLLHHLLLVYIFGTVILSSISSLSFILLCFGGSSGGCHQWFTLVVTLTLAAITLLKAFGRKMMA